MDPVHTNAKWYTAELVEEIVTDGLSGNTVYIHGVLVQADSAEAAYEKACRWAEENINEATRTAGGTPVHHVFRGFRDLYYCADEIQDGTVVSCEGPRPDVSDDELNRTVKPKWALDALVPHKQNWPV
ncbi:MAG TPA: DUF4288 domain-containing protein [Terriglobales bacterium]|nr:DUF4288 domain-containing protein [Terriglobales bacterium]